MRRKICEFIKMIKTKFSCHSYKENCSFEQKVRKLMRKKHFDESMMISLMDERELIRLDCDYKKYLYEFLTEYIEVKDKLLHDNSFLTGELIIK